MCPDTIKRSNYEGDSEMKMALDMYAKILLKQVADINVGMDVNDSSHAIDAS